MRKKPSKGIDVLNHFLVPPMRILTEEQAAKILKKYRIQKNQLPRMRARDPAVQALQAKAGDVIAIDRPDETEKHNPAYRLVVDE